MEYRTKHAGDEEKKKRKKNNLHEKKGCRILYKLFTLDPESKKGLRWKEKKEFPQMFFFFPLQETLFHKTRYISTFLIYI